MIKSVVDEKKAKNSDLLQQSMPVVIWKTKAGMWLNWTLI